jgi:hypothetical protein
LPGLNISRFSTINFGEELEEKDEVQHSDTSTVAGIPILSRVEPQLNDLSEGESTRDLLLSLVKVNLRSVEVCDDEDMEPDILSSLGNISFVVPQSSPESLKKQTEAREFIELLKVQESIDMDFLRDHILLRDQPEEDLGELFDNTIIVEEYVSEGDSDSSPDSSNENPGFFQMVEHPALLAQGYQFEKRSREALLSVPDFLLTLWLKPDLMQILASTPDMSALIKIIAGITKHHKKMKLSAEQKTVLKATTFMLKKILSDTVNPYQFGNNKGISVVKDSFCLWAMAAYETKESQREALNRSPGLKPVASVENVGGTNFWLKAPLRQRDFDLFVGDNRILMEFTKINKLTIILEALVPKIKLVEVDLLEDYGF